MTERDKAAAQLGATRRAVRRWETTEKMLGLSTAVSGSAGGIAAAAGAPPWVQAVCSSVSGGFVATYGALDPADRAAMGVKKCTLLSKLIRVVEDELVALTVRPGQVDPEVWRVVRELRMEIDNLPRRSRRLPFGRGQSDES
jgi:hypothetical protein